MNAQPPHQVPGPVLLADIGGTHCRLLLDPCEAGAAPIAKTYLTADFSSPEDAISAFVGVAGGPAPRYAALAVAGAVGAGVARLTNSDWHFDVEMLQRRLNLDQLVIVNDLEAQARAVLELGVGALTPIGRGWPKSSTLKDTITAVVGPGTGLGVAWFSSGRVSRALATEGGHVGYSPGSDLEMEMLRLWRNQLGGVTNEHVVSGPGLIRIHRALSDVRGVHAERIEGSEIVRRATARNDALCVEVADLYANILGGVCGDIALAQGASSLVLVGDMANALEPILLRGGFRARFEQRGPQDNFLVNTPTFLATADDLGLAGARRLLLDQLGAAAD